MSKHTLCSSSLCVPTTTATAAQCVVAHALWYNASAARRHTTRSAAPPMCTSWTSSTFSACGTCKRTRSCLTLTQTSSVALTGKRDSSRYSPRPHQPAFKLVGHLVLTHATAAGGKGQQGCHRHLWRSWSLCGQLSCLTHASSRDHYHRQARSQTQAIAQRWRTNLGDAAVVIFLQSVR